MAGALIILAQSGAVTPGPLQPATERPGRIMAPPPFDPGDIARRLGGFLIVAVLDLAASLMFAWAFRRALLRLGVLEANALSTGIFVPPIIWIALASWQMTMSRSVAMIGAAMGSGFLGATIWLAA